jgi:hypothetical protein
MACIGFTVRVLSLDTKRGYIAIDAIVAVAIVTVFNLYERGGKGDEL